MKQKKILFVIISWIANSYKVYKNKGKLKRMALRQRPQFSSCSIQIEQKTWPQGIIAESFFLAKQILHSFSVLSSVSSITSMAPG